MLAFERILTILSFTVHVRLAAGFEFFDVQFPRMISPWRYRGLIPFIDGRCSGTSEIMGIRKILIMYILRIKIICNQIMLWPFCILFHINLFFISHFLLFYLLPGLSSSWLSEIVVTTKRGNLKLIKRKRFCLICKMIQMKTMNLITFSISHIKSTPEFQW